MAANQTRKTISVSGAFYSAIQKWCDAHGVRLSNFAEVGLSVLTGVPLRVVPFSVVADRQRESALALEAVMTEVDARRETCIQDAKTGPIGIMLHDDFIDVLRDKTRTLNRRKKVHRTMGEVLDAGINKFLDKQGWPR
jgi:hypothetical protein